MDNPKSVELEILIAVSQNKNIPAHVFPQMFEHKWKLYNPTFNSLVQDGLFRIETNAGTSGYELTGKGKARIIDLIDQREKNIQFRLSAMNQKRPEAAPALKSKMSFLNYIAQWWVTSGNVKNSELQPMNAK
jgi:predicted transcriptional regulator